MSMIDDLVEISIQNLGAKNGRLFVMAAPDTPKDSLSDALMDIFLVHKKAEITQEIVEFIGNPKSMKILEKEYRKRVTLENNKLARPDMDIESHPLTKVLDDCILLTAPDGYPSEIWARKETGGFCSCGAFGDDKIADKIFFAVNYLAPSEVRKGLREAYMKYVGSVALENAAKDGSSRQKEPMPLIDYAVKHIKSYMSIVKNTLENN